MHVEAPLEKCGGCLGIEMVEPSKLSSLAPSSACKAYRWPSVMQHTGDLQYPAYLGSMARYAAMNCP